jgi:hypothetical protein
MHYTDYRHCDLQDGRAVDLHAHMSPSGVVIDVCITMGFSDAFVVVFIPILMTACSLPSAAWALDPKAAFADYHPIQRQEFASVRVSMVLDLAVIVPMPMAWKLQLQIREM